jgi:N6-adenosine-specific RNA methylase IME4
MIQANTVGNFLGYELDAVNTWIKATTGAQVKVSSTGLLNVQSTSMAFVGYKGKPEQKEFKTSLGGEITQQNP